MFPTVETRSPDPPVTLSALFIGFLKVSLCGFGGGLMWARRVVVEQQQWMSEQEFAETLTLCQLMPGPNIVGIAVCVGSKLRGRLGQPLQLRGSFYCRGRLDCRLVAWFSSMLTIGSSRISSAGCRPLRLGC